VNKPLAPPPADAAPRESFAERLKVSASRGQSVEFLGRAWVEVDSETPEDLEAAFSAALETRAAPGGAALGLTEALTVGVVASDGRIEHAEPDFARWFGKAAEDSRLSSLLAAARRQGASLGLVETADGVILSAWAGPGETAGRWPLSPAARTALCGGQGRLAVVIFAPSRSSALAERAATAFDLAPAEARLAEALVFAPTLEAAAEKIGIGRETARDTLKRIMAKAGVKRSTALVSRLVGLMAAGGPENPEADEKILRSTFGLTAAEARVAAACAAGLTAKEAGEALGLKAETVRGYVKAVLAKTGVVRSRDIARLLVEARELSLLSEVADAAFESAAHSGRLRVIAARDPARQIAFIDYGPRSNEAVFVFHGFATGRTLPRPLVRSLQQAGFRPIVPQRPGFGLTDPANDYVKASADDLETLIETLGLKDPRVFARDGGVVTALELARRNHSLVSRYLLLNPRAPKAMLKPRRGLIDTFSLSLLSNPKLVYPVTEFLRRHANRTNLESNLRQTCAHAAADRACLEDPAVVEGLVRDIQALTARTATGFAAQYAVYANGWTPPHDIAGGSWTVLWSSDQPPEPREPFAHLPGVRFGTIEGGGLLTHFTHPAELTAAIVAL